MNSQTRNTRTIFRGPSQYTPINDTSVHTRPNTALTRPKQQRQPAISLRPESGRIRVDLWEEIFDAVVIATGGYTTFMFPSSMGSRIGVRRSLTGRGVSTTHNHIHPERYSSKPNPLRDASGFDILFRYPPKVPELATFHPLGRCDVGIKDSKIELLSATGYHRNTFLPEQVNPKAFDNLYWIEHYIHDPTLAYATARPWTHGRYQSAGFTKVRAGTARLPNKAQMWEDYITGTFRSEKRRTSSRRKNARFMRITRPPIGGRLASYPLPLQPFKTKLTTVYSFSLNWFTHDNYTHFDKEWPKPSHLGDEFGLYDGLGLVKNFKTSHPRPSGA
ncbi:hypothetical protein DFH07DRAFT_779470 [Mycena maculata]|uniref:FAD/NAD(P)-binding domain-containing protein n=1 Tax=Mycena maculata TaxID=230809 RepID=A0AAD7I844_9AGAR|nr:hypothetical protein DFH07DRAFT_779470 [Mycena maculata]